MSPNPTTQTGPRTENGKAVSSQNAVTDGLFTANDFVRPGEEDEYTALRDGLLARLNPEDMLESTLAGAVITASWRLRRCGLIEAAMAVRCSEDCTLSPEDENRQKSVDRARAHALNTLRRGIADLRRLQTDRNVITELDQGAGVNWGLTDFTQIYKAFHLQDSIRQSGARADERDFKNAMDSVLGAPGSPTLPPPPSFAQETRDTLPADASLSFCKPPQPAARQAAVSEPGPGRNQPCPCKSGLKFKKCCGGPNGAVNRKAA